MPNDIQEFYELTLLDDTKTVQQKTQETLQIASKWEASAGHIAVEAAITANDADKELISEVNYPCHPILSHGTVYGYKFELEIPRR
ncbi:hypothetical protein HAZT_HAZT007570 [Hyalella azteca]|uniref:Uncharacterized protein n=1 Tax=Hyalella azteca TaxID=294128 RepID=A0A6A0H936_HYAAZ|nr:hypothetical protein HAZT_HAZT007570 [Hyalella azteca]